MAQNSFNKAAAYPDAAQNALFDAAKTGDLAVIAEILRAHPDAVNWPNPVKNGDEPFGKNSRAHIVAAEYGQAEAVALLLKHGAEVNARHHRGWSALMHAAWNGRMEAVKVLLEYRADTLFREDNGMIAETMARQRGHNDIGSLIAKAERDDIKIFHSGVKKAMKPVKTFRVKT